MTVAPASNRLRVLHGLRLAGFADTDRVAARAGAAERDVAEVLTAADAGGLVRRREGRMPGWMLTAAGRSEGERLLAEELEATGARGVVAEAYRRFLELNGELLTVCTAWQVRDESSQRLNDHADEAYDASVVERLAALDRRVRPVCADLAGTLDRFGDYGARFAAALERVLAGEQDWFAKPLIDSYHTVWFELHEDLLATLGIERSGGGAG